MAVQSLSCRPVRVVLALLAAPLSMGAQGLATPPVTTRVAPTAPELLAIRDTVLAWVRAGRIPSMAIVVGQGDDVLWDEAIGWADRERDLPASTSLAYPLGSVAKSIAATAMMTLVEDGTVALTEPIAPLLAPASLRVHVGDARQVTIERLLNASAGIPHGWLSWTEEDDYPTSPVQWERTLARMTQVMFEPGTTWEYSNFSLGLVQPIIERLTGERYERYVQRAVFAPLGMDSSFAGISRDMHAHLVTSYSAAGTRLPPSWSAPVGGLNAHASARDLYRFGRLHAKRPIGAGRGVLADSTLDLMHRYADGPPSPFALGWYRGDDALTTNGQVGGGNAHLGIHQPSGTVAACLLNATSNGYGLADQICDQIMAALVPGSAERGASRFQAYMAQFENPYEPTPALAGSWQGAVMTDTGPRGVTLQFPDAGPPRITLAGDTTVAVENSVFNRVQRFTGSFPATLVIAEGGESPVEVSALLTLQVTDDRATGYLLARFGTERGGFAIPLHVAVRRVEGSSG